MLDDNLNEKKLQAIIGAARFNNEKDFKDFLKPKLADNFSIDEARLEGGVSSENKRHDLFVLDALTKREALIVVGIKTINLTPQLTPEHFQAFHKTCEKMEALYGVLLTEIEAHFFQYQTGGMKIEPKEVKDIPPLHYIDAEFGRKISFRTLKDFALSHQKWCIVIGIFLILMLATSLARASICKETGPVKAEINSRSEKIYYLPSSAGYTNRTTGDQPGERRYCEEASAIDGGWIKAK